MAIRDFDEAMYRNLISQRKFKALRWKVNFYLMPVCLVPPHI